MREWQRLLKNVYDRGDARPDRTGVGTLSLPGQQITLTNNAPPFPAVTTKKLFIEQVIAELCAFLRGYTTLDEFHAVRCNIWDANGKAEYWTKKGFAPGYLGRIYGAQWRHWTAIDNQGSFTPVDQLQNLVDGIKKDPFGRRHIVTAWNPGELDEMCLPPCHIFFQAYVSSTFHLDLVVYMRSVDLFLGLPFDIASYAILQRLIAKDTELQSRNLIFNFGDAHIYKNHLEQVKTILTREPFFPPIMILAPEASINNFHPNMVTLRDYQHHAAIKAEMNV